MPKPTCKTCDDSKFIEAGGRQVSCRDCEPAAQLKADQERFRANARLMNPGELQAENTILRRLLWIAYSQGKGYGDDGEMQFEGIDFKRMTIEEIQNAITRCGVQRIPSRPQPTKPVIEAGVPAIQIALQSGASPGTNRMSKTE